METRNAQDPWIRWAVLPSKQVPLPFLWFLLPCSRLSSPSRYGKSCWKIPQKVHKVIPISLEPLHLLWMKSALHPSSGPPTDASCSCTLFPVCTQTLLSEDVATAKLGHGLNLNGAALNEAVLLSWQEKTVFHGLILTVQSLNLKISASDFLDRLLAALQPGWQRYKRNAQRWTSAHLIFVWWFAFDIVTPCCPSLSQHFTDFKSSATQHWLTCGINSLSDELPWLDLQKDVYDWGLFLLRPPPQLPARPPDRPGLPRLKSVWLTSWAFCDTGTSVSKCVCVCPRMCVFLYVGHGLVFRGDKLQGKTEEGFQCSTFSEQSTVCAAALIISRFLLEAC